MDGDAAALRARLTGALVVLDWNGTTVDDAARTRAALNAALARFGRPPLAAAAYVAQFKLPMAAMMAGLGLPEAEIGPAIRAWNDEIGRREAPLARGAEVLIRGMRVRGRPVGVISAAAAEVVKAEAACLGILADLGFLIGDAEPKAAPLRELVRTASGPVLCGGDTEYDITEALAAGALAVVDDLALLRGEETGTAPTRHQMTPQGGSVAPRRPGAAEIDALAAEVAAALGRLPGVVAVAAAGSHLAGADDPDSDIDLYVYAAKPPPLAARAALAARFATAAEIGNTAWEPGDEWVDTQTGIAVDVIYRTPAWIEAELDRVLVRHEASLGWSTCFWHNVLHSRPLVDRAGWYRRLRAAAARPYPEPLKRAVVARNHPILRQTLSSYRHQIALAVRRDDAVSVQHRTTALLASAFDILFAVNELPHPGEKRLLWHATTRCARLPHRFADEVKALLGVAASPPSGAILTRVDALLDGLDDLLAGEGLLPTR